MRKVFETPEINLFDMSSDEIMDVLSTEYVPYDPSTDSTGGTEYPDLPDEF